MQPGLNSNIYLDFSCLLSNYLFLGKVNGRNHYKSVHGDGAFVLAYCGDSWWIQSSEVRGECKGWAHSGWESNKCVHNIDYSWRYFIPQIDEFVEAEKGLSVWCKS